MRFLNVIAGIMLATNALPTVADDVLDQSAAGAVAKECPRPSQEKSLKTAYGSVGFMKNMAESADSIRTIAVGMLSAALSAENTQLPDGCESGCAGPEMPEVVYRVSPIAFLDEAKQNEVCLTLEDQTSAEPMRFEPRSFASVSEMNDWIMAFSQGRGDDGKALYERCTSNCSPRYTFLIAEQSGSYEIRAEVLCGLARDKSNDQYLISTALRRRCTVN